MPIADRVIRWASTLVVLIVASVALWISYWHAVEVIERAGGESSLSAHLLPATVDGLAGSASLVLLFAARYRLPVPRLARFAVAMGIGATLAANITHGAAHGLAAGIIAAWPACALVVSYELAMWIVSASRMLEKRTTVVVEHTEERDPKLDAAVEMLAKDATTTAAAIGRFLEIPYDKARLLTKEARALIAAAQ